jgi:hypothetical protein
MEFLASVLNTILVAAIPLVVGYAVQFIKVKTANEKLNGYLDIATEAVQKAVLETSQIYVDALKSGGVFTEDEQKTAFSMSVEKAKTLMGNAALEALAKLTGDAQGWIQATVEATIKQSK